MFETVYRNSSSKDPDNSLLYVAGSEDIHHIKIINKNTIQNWYMHTILVCYTTKSVGLEWLSLQHFSLLSPIRKLPCMLQPAMVVTTQWNALLRKTLTWTSKITKGFVKVYSWWLFSGADLKLSTWLLVYQSYKYIVPHILMQHRMGWYRMALPTPSPSILSKKGLLMHNTCPVSEFATVSEFVMYPNFAVLPKS